MPELPKWKSAPLVEKEEWEKAPLVEPVKPAGKKAPFSFEPEPFFEPKLYYPPEIADPSEIPSIEKQTEQAYALAAQEGLSLEEARVKIRRGERIATMKKEGISFPQRKSLGAALRHGKRRMTKLQTRAIAGLGRQLAEVKGIEASLLDPVFRWMFDLPKELDIDKMLIDMSEITEEEVRTRQKKHPEEAYVIDPDAGYSTALWQVVSRPENLVQGLVESLPLVLEGTLGTIVGGVPAGVAFMAVPISGEVYATAREEKTKILPAFAQAAIVGVGEAIIEEWTLGRKIGLAKGFRSMISKGLPRVLWEGTKAFFRGTAEEGSQEFNRNFWRWVFTDRSQAWFEGVQQAMAMGGPLEAALAGAFAGAGAVGTPVSQKEARARLSFIRKSVEKSKTLTTEQKAEIGRELDKVEGLVPDIVEKREAAPAAEIAEKPPVRPPEAITPGKPPAPEIKGIMSRLDAAYKDRDLQRVQTLRSELLTELKKLPETPENKQIFVAARDLEVELRHKLEDVAPAAPEAVQLETLRKSLSKLEKQRSHEWVNIVDWLWRFSGATLQDKGVTKEAFMRKHIVEMREILGYPQVKAIQDDARLGELAPAMQADLDQLITQYERTAGRIGDLQEQIRAAEAKPPAAPAGVAPPTISPMGKRVLFPVAEPTLPSQIGPPSDIDTSVVVEEPGAEPEKIKDAREVEKMFDTADEELKAQKTGKLGKLKAKMVRAVYDVSGNIKSELLKSAGALGKEAVIQHDLISGAQTRADMLTQEANDRIYGDLNRAEHKLLDRIIQSRRIIAIDKAKFPLFEAGFKHPLGITGPQARNYLDSIPKDTFARLNKRADAYFAETQSQLDQLLKEGLITESTHKSLTEVGEYELRRFIQHIDPDITYTFGGRKISVPDSGIKKLEEGSYKVLENNSELLLANTIARTQARIMRNRANQALWEVAQQVPDNGIVREAERETVTGKGITYKRAPGGFEKISVVIEGKHREMLMPSDMAREWVKNDPQVSYTVATIIGWLSGAKIVRTFATGINLEFAVGNFPRDVAHAWLVSSEWSSILPIALGQMAVNYTQTAKDTFTRGKSWRDYIMEGGGMGFLTHQGRISRAGGFWGRVQDILGYVGETSEIWTRLALRNKAMKNGKLPYEATWEARNYIDFSQGGSFAKAADTGVPYLNAAIQGTRGIFRAAKNNPVLFLWKISQMSALAIGLFLANRFRNKDCWEQVSDHDKANYFIITTNFSYIDTDGQKRYYYFRVAKDQGQKIICSIAENLIARSLGDKFDVDQVTTAARDMMNITPVDLMPPTLDASLGYFANKNFWFNDDIWRGPKVKPSEEFRPGAIHPVFVKAGEVTTLSPERLRYALQQVFTYRNIYTDLVGGGLSLIMDDLPQDVRERTTKEMLEQYPFIRKVAKVTSPYTAQREIVEKEKIDESTRKLLQNRELDARAELYYSGKRDRTYVTSEFIRKQPLPDRERLERRFKRYGEIRNIPDRAWWLGLADLPPEVRARVYWLRYQTVTSAEKAQMTKTLRKISGMRTERFNREMRKLER